MAPFQHHVIMNPAISTLVLGIEILLFAYFLFSNCIYLATSLVAICRMPWFVKVHRADPIRYVYSPLEVPVSVLVPAYNEAEGILDTVRSLLQQKYSTHEIIIINDGSTDATLDLLKEDLALEPFPEAYSVHFETQPIHGIYQSMAHPNLRVIDKANGGKGDALNAGINAARHPLVFACDADSYYSPDALQCLSEAFAKDPKTVVSAASIGVSNGCTFENGKIVKRRLSSQWIARFQVLEYMRAFLGSRMGWAPFNALCIVSGACGLYKKDILIAAGGYRTDTIWEDLEMTLRVHRMMRKRGRPYRIAFTPFVVCWTRVPDTLRALWRQRLGWHQHVSECVTIHRGLLMSPSGVIGWLGFPYLVIGEWLSPFLVLFGLAFGFTAAYFGFLSYYSQIVLLGLVFTLGLAICTAAMMLDELSFNTYSIKDLTILLLSSLFEFFGYRQFVTLAAFVGIGAWLVGRSTLGGKTIRGWKLRPYTP